MELNAEARRILAVSISKLYASRSQRGGLRLHRSLLVSLVMKSARDIYHSSAAATGPAPARTEQSTEQAMEAMDTSEPGEESHRPGEDSHRARETQPHQPREDTDQRRETQPRELRHSTEDKENHSPRRPSRKRPGKASAAPAFLPEKRARLEPGEERHEAAGSPSSCRGTQTLAPLPFNRVISAF